MSSSAAFAERSPIVTGAAGRAAGLATARLFAGRSAYGRGRERRTMVQAAVRTVRWSAPKTTRAESRRVEAS